MKKLIAIAVVFALATSFVFAEATVGGQLQIGTNFLAGNSVEDSALQTGPFAFAEGKLVTSFGDDTAGGKLVFTSTNWAGATGNFGSWGFLYWKPIPQVRLQIGQNSDGDWGAAQISGWGFTAAAKNNSAALNDYNDDLGPMLRKVGIGFYGGISGKSINLSFLNLAPGLTINLGLPNQANPSDRKGVFAGEIFSRFHANIVYGIEGVGTARLSFIGGPGYHDAASPWGYNGTTGQVTVIDTPQLFFSFDLTAIEGVRVDLGVAYKLPMDKIEMLSTNGNVTVANYQDGKTNYPVQIGLGLTFSSGDFGAKLRAGLEFGGQLEPEGGTTYKSPTILAVNILPYYKIGTSTVFLFAGLGIQAVDDWEDYPGPNGLDGRPLDFVTNESNSVVGWFVNPYVQIPAGGATFFAGFQLWSTGVKDASINKGDPVVKWAIPFGLNFQF